VSWGSSVTKYIFVELKMKKQVGRASVPAAFGGTGFPACASHRQDAGATKHFSDQKKLPAGGGGFAIRLSRGAAAFSGYRIERALNQNLL
jgi:hypothetical protein